MELSQYDEDLVNALIHAYYNEAELKQFVTFGLKQPFAAIVPPGNLRTQVSELIAWAAAGGMLDTLFRVAIERRPGNPELRSLAARLAGDVLDEHKQLADEARHLSTEPFDNPYAGKVRNLLAAYKPAGGSLEALATRVAHLRAGPDVVAWARSLEAARRRIGSIGAGADHAGTAFLIGPDRIITNDHVVGPGTPPATLDVAFDYAGKDAARSSLTTYRLAEELARSPIREADFAIFRLDRPPAGNRGYFRVKPHTFDQVREPICILGHSNGDPLTFSFGVVFDVNSLFGRVAYTANTLPGASGSPVFDEDWGVVALHHHGEENVNNHGVVMKTIAERLEKQGKANLIEIG